MRYYSVLCDSDDCQACIGIYSNEKIMIYAQNCSYVQYEYRADIGIFVLVDWYWCMIGTSYRYWISFGNDLDLTGNDIA